VNLSKVSEIVIQDLRSGRLGNISLEAPGEKLLDKKKRYRI
jgi:ribosome biogenesis GTPase A